MSLLNLTSVRRTFAAAAVAALALPLAAVAAVQPQARIAAAVDDSNRTMLPGTHSPRARAANDIGALSASTPVGGMSLVFTRTAAQEADLAQLLGQLQDASSPQYHQWLTPAQFATRFGLADSDLAKVEGWLTAQGFQVTGVSNAHDRVFFSGTAAQVSAAFGTELHRFQNEAGEEHFAPMGDLSIPAALAGVVRTVSNVSSFRPHPHVHVKPRFTSSQTGNHFLTPADLAVIYDINAVYNSGYTGSGQTIAVVGQSAINTTDITNFQTAAGVPVRAPNVVLMPGTGTSTTVTGDETESDLDLEYTSGVARGANVTFVYTGNNQNYGVFDALQYTIDNKLANIISVSYGDCETDLSAADYATLDAMLAQAAAQGESVIAAAGDNGSTDCYEDKNLTLAQREGVSADFPSVSEYVTGLGGTMLTSAAVASGSSYWQSASGSDVIGSALSYVPEQVWNNDSATLLSAGGGGVSVFTARPSWQTGVTGIASGSYRLTPDVSLAASPENAGYLYCSEDIQATGITGSCAKGFRDSNGNYLTVAGGTSFAAPVFAGMVAILEQRLNNTTGLGLLNPTLYTLASNSTTYASAFHDITVGSNGCLSGSAICTAAGAGSYAAGTGYDSATGLGSVDFNNLLNVWPGVVAPKSFTVAAAGNVSLTAGSNGTTSIGVTPVNGYTGTVVFTVTPSATLANVCYTLPSVTVSGTTAVQSTLTVYTSATTCATASGAVSLSRASAVKSAALKANSASRVVEAGAAALAGLLLFTGMRRRKLQPLLAVGAVMVLGFGLSGCGSKTVPAASTTTGTGTGSGSGTATAGTYTLKITGTDSVTNTITSSTNVTLTIN